MDTMTHGDPQLDSLLSGFDNPDASEVRIKPNIKMTIKSNNAVSGSNNRGASTRITKCRGKLVRKGNQMVPKIRCSSMKLNSPNKKKQRQAALLEDIFGEVNKQQKENNVMEVPKQTSHGCGCSKMKKRACGAPMTLPTNPMPTPSIHSTMNIDMDEPPAVFNQVHNTDPMNTESMNAQSTKVKGTRRRKGKGKSKGKKQTHKVVQLSLDGNKPTIPEVRIKRKRRGSGTKKAKAKSKGKTPKK